MPSPQDPPVGVPTEGTPATNLPTDAAHANGDSSPGGRGAPTGDTAFATTPELVPALLTRLRGRLERLEVLLPERLAVRLPERRSRPLWHWYTTLDRQEGADPAPPWVRIPPVLERAPLALEDWTATFGHRLWLDRTQDLPAGPAAYRRTHGEDSATGTTPTALGLPGIWEDWRYFHLWAQALHEGGWDVHLLETLGDMTAPIPDLAELVTEYLHLHDLHDVVLFAHSKGGLVGKTVMLGPEGDRVRGLIACATPFNGAPITHLVPNPELAELAPGSPTITRLGAESTVNTRIIQVEAEWDQSVPPSPLDGVRHITLPITGHSAMLFSPEVARTLTVLARQLMDEGDTPPPVGAVQD